VDVDACLSEQLPGGEPLRPPTGRWFPSEREELKKTVAGYLKAAPAIPLPGRIVALIAPHAGFVYSGPVAASAYRQLAGREVDTVILVGPAHRHPLDGMSVVPKGSYGTPLGTVPVDEEIARGLLGCDERIRHVPEAHRLEHSLQNQVPFLQCVLKKFRIVPVLIRARDPDDYVILSEALSWVAEDSKKKILLVSSTDLSHFPSYEDAKKVDRDLLEAFETMDARYILRRDREILKRKVPDLACSACGLDGAIAVLLAAKELGGNRLRVLDYRNSYDTARHDRSRVVGYGACVVTAEKSEGLSLEAKQELLDIARRTLEAVLAGKPIPDFEAENPELKKHGGAFVTLKKKGKLRGCIGRYPEEGGTVPLSRIVAEMAQSSAQRDPRFPAVTAEELDDLSIEISVLSLPRKVKSADEIILGRHGVIIKKGFRQGTYLPQVATDTGWSKEQFLGSLCAHKAGLPEDAWKTDPEVEIWIYDAEVFHE
jgi:AmmeMemoRadiSam system protein B/AmmeMemoRadiSam system protein A